MKKLYLSLFALCCLSSLSMIAMETADSSAHGGAGGSAPRRRTSTGGSTATTPHATTFGDVPFDDSRTIGADGYESDGSTFDEAVHIDAAKLPGYRLAGGYGYTPVGAAVAAIKKEVVPTAAGKRAKMVNTAKHLEGILSDLNTRATPEEFDTVVDFVVQKQASGARIVSRHALSGTRDAAKAHENNALLAATYDISLARAQAARVGELETLLAAERRKLAQCQEKACGHTATLARRERTTHLVLALQAKPGAVLPDAMFSTGEDEGAAPKTFAYADFERVVATRTAALPEVGTPVLTATRATIPAIAAAAAASAGTSFTLSGSAASHAGQL